MEAWAYLHCLDCSWEGQAKDCAEYGGARACPVCGSDAIPYSEWLTEKAEER